MLMGYLKAGELNVEFIDVEPKLEEYYKLLDVDLIDIVERKIGDTYFDIILDDEGLLKDSPTVTAVNTDFKEYLVGSLLLCHTDGEGAEAPITEEDIETIKQAQTLLVDGETGEANGAIFIGL